MPPVDYRGQLLAAETELRSIHETAGDEPLTAEQDARFTELAAERSRLLATIKTEDDRRSLVASLAAVPAQAEAPTVERSFSAPNVIIKQDPFDVLSDRSLYGDKLVRALVDSNIRAMDGHEIGGADNERHFEQTIKRHAASDEGRWASNILARSRDEYTSAWTKMITGRSETLNELERAAITVGTNTAGGYLVPTFLDPTILISNAGSSNVMRQYATIKQLTVGNVWHGVTSAGATASWDAEATEVSDDTPAFATVSIALNKPQSFIRASLEAFDDIANLANDVLMIFADAKDRLEGSGHMTGLGSSNQPKGLFTAINASSTLQVVSTTAATLGEVDIHALYRALPIRWRGKGSFVMNPLYSTAIKRLGTALSSSYSGNLTEPVSSRILDKPVVETDDAPTTQTTTALDQEVVFASLDEYYIIDRPGSTSIEFIPNLLNLSTNIPDGTRGWYLHWRTGADMPNVAGGRILVDKTSA